MKKTRFDTVLAGITVWVTVTFLLLSQVVCAEPQCRIVRIYDEAASGPLEVVRIEPASVLAQGAVCVIWVNLGKAAMKVRFNEGKKCVDATNATTGFSLLEGCYVTNWVPYGGTSSITFKEKGTYAYEVEWEAAGAQAKGTIVVE